MLARRLTAQGLAGPPAADPDAVAERLLAVQAQDLRGARLAVRSRSRGLTAADVDRALSHDRTLVVDWLNRGTLHLVRREDHGWLHALTAPTLRTGNARRLEQEGVAPAQAERGVVTIERALAVDGPQSRESLRGSLDAAGVPTAGQAFIHVLMLASLRGVCVRGPVIDGGHHFALRRDWLGEAAPVARDRALAELARRYLRGHGPALDRDLARWAGLPLRDARLGLAAIAGELEPGPAGLVDLAGRGAPAALPAPRLLGPFDPLLLGWVSREPVLGNRAGVVTRNGIFRAIALVRGRAVATWRMPQGTVELEPFGRLGAAERRGLAVEAADVVRFLGA